MSSHHRLMGFISWISCWNTCFLSILVNPPMRIPLENFEDLVYPQLTNVLFLSWCMMSLVLDDSPSISHWGSQELYPPCFSVPWILSFMIYMVMPRALASNALMIPWCILISWSYINIWKLMIGPFLWGRPSNHSGYLFLPLSLVLFFNFLHLSDDMNFFTSISENISSSISYISLYVSSFAI